MPSADRDPSEVTRTEAGGAGLVPLPLRRRPRIEWSDASGAQTYTVSSRAVIGSGDGVDVVVRDPAVSRLHAELDMREDGLWITDLGSKNGSYVEGVRVASARLPDRGRARLGSTEIVARYGAAPSNVELWHEPRFGALVGGSVVMRALFARIARVAPTDETTLVTGETGTGKELVAHAIHEASSRANGPFVVVDCASLPEDLLEAELFGHARGAFTGAVAARVGAIEAADGGTLFLDELGELPLSMQPKLLRVLESHAIRRIGETGYRNVNVRVISATHRDLRAMVNAGSFREDLFFRLAVLPLEVPPLRQRIDDIPLLARHCLLQGAHELPADVLREMSLRPWLGNVRELKNFVRRFGVFGASDALVAESKQTASPLALPSPPLDQPLKDLREAWLNHLEREYLGGLLALHQGNIVAVAAAAGIDRTHVYRLLRKHSLELVRPSDKPVHADAGRDDGAVRLK